jgi:hypothetical protein
MRIVLKSILIRNWIPMNWIERNYTLEGCHKVNKNQSKKF